MSHDYALVRITERYGTPPELVSILTDHLQLVYERHITTRLQQLRPLPQVRARAAAAPNHGV